MILPTMGRIRKRIYLGNLPFDATEEEVTKKFSKFGNVLNVEMKYQSDVSFDVGLPCYAFLDLEVGDNDLNSCFSKIKAKNWRGNAIKIEIAKESFLSRLERERKNNSHSAENSISSPVRSTQLYSDVSTKKGNHIKFEENEDEMDQKQPVSEDDTNILKKPKKSKKRRESLEQISSETHEEAAVLDKFESFSNVWKDEPQELNSTQKTEKKEKKEKKKKKSDQLEVVETEDMSIEERNKIAEERRLKSLADREKSMKQQKNAVKLALSSVDSNKGSNKLKFRYDDDEDDEPAVHVGDQTKKNKPSHHTHKKPGLFPDHNSSDDDDEEAFTFAVKKQFEGKQGQKLLNLKSTYGNDSRFVLDERFYDGEEGNYEDDADASTNDEVHRQLEILKGIVGENLPRGPNRVQGQTQKPGQNFMLRFDPTIADHRKFELSKDEKSNALVNEQKEKNKKKRDMEAPAVEVSKAKYYKVADSLKESLKTTESGGFSLLQMFGEQNDVGSDEDTMDTEALSTDWKQQKSKHSHPGNVDFTPRKEQEKSSAVTEHAPIVASWGETFFYKSDDSRLFDGIKFFKTQSECQDFRALRYELRDICRHKLDAARRKARESRNVVGNRAPRGGSRGGSRGGATRGHRGRH